MPQDRKSRLQEFADWAAAHITGDEKGRLHSLSLGERVRVRVLDRLFQAFGQKGLLEVGGTAEVRIRKAKKVGSANLHGISPSQATTLVSTIFETQSARIEESNTRTIEYVLE